MQTDILNIETVVHRIHQDLGVCFITVVERRGLDFTVCTKSLAQIKSLGRIPLKNNLGMKPGP